MEYFERFQLAPWLHRGDEYNDIKNHFRNELTNKVIELFPQIKDHIIHAEVSTPLSTKTFCNYQSGEIYGLEHSPERFKLNCLSPATSIKGLYLTGQDITLVGVTAAMMSGILTAITILKWRVMLNFKDMFTNYN
jgi:all-trans-retinol 13,14-reductase